MMIDTHAHIFKEDYDNVEEIIKKMGNNIIIVSGTNEIDNKEVIELVNKYDNVYGTLGIHPSEADKDNNSLLDFISKNITNKKIVGIGEVGLDYYWVKDNKDRQKELFIKQIELAKKYNKTVVVQSREAITDTYNIIKEYKDVKFNIHAYSSSLEMALEFIKLGCKLGIGGVLTFKNSKKLKEVVKNVPLESLMLETDSPYLTPEPYRGKKNEPYNIIYVAKEIAALKEISVEKVLDVTSNTSISQFDLPI